MIGRPAEQYHEIKCVPQVSPKTGKAPPQPAASDNCGSEGRAFRSCSWFISVSSIVHPAGMRLTQLCGNEFYHTIGSFFIFRGCKRHLGCASFNDLGNPHYFSSLLIFYIIPQTECFSPQIKTARLYFYNLTVFEVYFYLFFCIYDLFLSK